MKSVRLRVGGGGWGLELGAGPVGLNVRRVCVEDACPGVTFYHHVTTETYRPERQTTVWERSATFLLRRPRLMCARVRGQ